MYYIVVVFYQRSCVFVYLNNSFDAKPKNHKNKRDYSRKEALFLLLGRAVELIDF